MDPQGADEVTINEQNHDLLWTWKGHKMPKHIMFKIRERIPGDSQVLNLNRYMNSGASRKGGLAGLQVDRETGITFQLEIPINALYSHPSLLSTLASLCPRLHSTGQRLHCSWLAEVESRMVSAHQITVLSVALLRSIICTLIPDSNLIIVKTLQVHSMDRSLPHSCILTVPKM